MVAMPTDDGLIQVNCLVGAAPAGANVAKLYVVLLKNLRFAADALAREHIRLLIEPINTTDIPGFFLNGTEQAVQIIADVRSDISSFSMTFITCR